MSEPQTDPTRRFFAMALMAVGGLITALCGTCTLVFAGATVVDSLAHPRELLSILLMVGLVGGLPTLIGALVFRWGWGLRRPLSKVRAPELAVFSDEPREPRP